MRTLATLDQNDAKIIIKAAIDKAKLIQVPVCVAVVDTSCELLAFVRMDGAKYHSSNVAMDKAYTAASTRGPTLGLGAKAAPGMPLYGIQTQQGGRFCIVGGGIPVLHDGQCVGAVGISSGSVDQDIEIAQAAVESLN